MPYIKQVRIQGFQSHIDSTFTLSPGLSIITGPSDAGKTAIIRALRWLAFNEPQGEAFIHAVRDADGNLVSQAEQATVTVELDDGTVISKTRRKGKTIYTHSAYADPWEKAELPLEIKETLGLHKQHYGDNFETCLNFAYQLDPPFMLSETGSTGAKILGKLAGTEVVDKAIGAVVKQTHQTREIIRQSEKAIGQYDVELLEFLHTEEHLERVENLTKQYSAVEAKIKSIGQLAELGKRYSTYRVRRDEAYATLIQLESVPTLVASLEKVDSIYDRLQQIKGLAKAFWDSVHKRGDLHTKLKRLSEVPELAVDLQQIQKDNGPELLPVPAPCVGQRGRDQDQNQYRCHRLQCADEQVAEDGDPCLSRHRQPQDHAYDQSAQDPQNQARVVPLLDDVHCLKLLSRYCCMH